MKFKSSITGSSLWIRTAAWISLLLLIAIPFNTALADSAGPRNAGLGADLAGIGTIAWTNPNWVRADDNNYATAILLQNEISHYLRASNFGFALPAGSSVDGITVEISRGTGSLLSPLIRDYVVSLVNGSAAIVGDNKADTTTDWPTDETIATYGSAADTWNAGLTDTDVNDTDFGVVLAVTNPNVTSRTAYVDLIRITVTYRLPDTTSVNCGSGTPVVVYGSSIICQATVTRSVGSGTPTGPVNWSTGGSGSFTPASCDLSGTGATATCSVTYTPDAVGTGSHLITATYAGDASFQSSYGTQSVTVNKKALTVSAMASNKVYDGTTAATATLTTDALAGDDVTAAYTSATFADEDVGVGKTVTVSGITIGGADAGNYNLLNTSASATADITAKDLTVTATASDKVYDGTTAATATLTTDALAGDDVTAAYTDAAFEDKNVGAGKTVTVSGITVGGVDVGNYNLLNTSATASASITARDLTVTATAADKVYDGTTAATATLTTDALAGDEVTAAYTDAAFEDKDVGAGKTVTVSGITIGGTDAGNYHLLNDTATASASITAKGLTVTAEDKEINAGEPDPTFTFKVEGFVAPDTFVTEPTCGVTGAHTAPGEYDIECSGGDAGSNYQISYVKGKLTVDAVPTNILLSKTSVSENMPIGTVVGTLTAEGLGEGYPYVYAFCGGVDDASFSIAGDVLKTAAVFDYETKTSYQICLSTDNGKGGVYKKNFTITVIDIAGVELVFPEKGVAIHYNRPTFDWNEFAGAIGYQLQVARNDKFTNMVFSKVVKGGTNSSFMRPVSLPANKLLYWRVRAKLTATKYSDWSAVWTFTTANPPSRPMLQSPAGGALVTGPSPLFNWKDSTVPLGVVFDHYQIQIATDTAFSAIVHDQDLAGITNSQDDSAVLTSGTTYYWRVRAYAQNGDYSVWSAVRRVRIRFDAPVLLLPENGKPIGNLLPSFSWNGVTGAKSYTIQVSKVATFSTVTLSKTVLTPQYATLVSLKPGTTYYWRVRVNGSYGPSAWSEVWSFTTP